MARHAVVRGVVQGVGFRYFAHRAARELNLRGWVRNLPDGSVETVAEGADAAVTEYLSRLSRGPSGARVDGVEVEAVELRNFPAFEIAR